MILFEKFNKNEILPDWTHLFNTVDELLNYMKDHKNYLIGKDYSIRIRYVDVYEIKDLKVSNE